MNKLIVGLGNPGESYQDTRHNVGQRILDALIGDDFPARLYKPRAFYNLVGPEVAEQLRFHKLLPGDLLVLHDELDLPFGEIRLQAGKSSAGNHGVDSIIGELGTNAFWRLRIGTGPRGETPGDRFVLERFTKVEEKEINKVIESAKEIIKDWLEKD